MNNEKLIVGGPSPDLPAFMHKDEITGTEGLGEFIRPPRIKVVQPLSKDLTNTFDAGDVVILPQKVLLSPVKKNANEKPETTKSGAGNTFHLVPLFFWPEWISWNPREITDEDAVRERTTDPNSPLVQKCRNRELWLEPHPNKPDLSIRHVEHLNYIVMIMSGDFTGTPAVMSFFRAEHKAGTNLAALIQMRKAPIFGCVFEASTGFRENPQGQWYGLDIVNPQEDSGFTPFVDSEEMYCNFRKLHEEYKTAHASGLVEVVHDDVSGEEQADDSSKF